MYHGGMTSSSALLALAVATNQWYEFSGLLLYVVTNPLTALVLTNRKQHKVALLYIPPILISDVHIQHTCTLKHTVCEKVASE